MSVTNHPPAASASQYLVETWHLFPPGDEPPAVADTRLWKQTEKANLCTFF